MGEDGAHTVLVVDDDADIRDVLRDVLERRRYHVLLAQNGSDALTCLRSIHVDAIVLDLAMPKMDGWQFLSHRERDARLVQVPVVVVTAHRDRMPDRDPRIAAVVWKPFSAPELLAVVRRCCTRS